MANSPKWGHILKGASSFAQIRGQRRLKLAHGASLTFLPTNRSVAKLGIVLPKRVGSAVRRNRIRRVIRSWAWAQLPQLPPRQGVLHLTEDPLDSLPALLKRVEVVWTS
ncbi:ribonuclease P protein component [bacterium]|nr:ribonuclease P protein component [bacterium]